MGCALRYNRFVRNLVIIPLAFSSIWSWLAGFWLLLRAAGTRVTQTVDPGGVGEVVTEHIPWYQAQGWWGIVILLVFMAFYTAPLYFYQRQRTTLFIIFTLAAIILTWISGFSIGLVYLPAASVLFLGLLLHFVIINTPGRLRPK